ncbi:hypothetical protein SDC9_37155 [bioreactor metagenome]|uniref:Uncharacterized protein n=1 Tax=bioreactor metagenome TaxID=1076179 RepID=A0A644VKA4_9ZZZZ
MRSGESSRAFSANQPSNQRCAPGPRTPPRAARHPQRAQRARAGGEAARPGRRGFSAVAALIDLRRHHAHQLEHHRGAGERRHAADVEGRRHFDHIGAGDVHRTKEAQHLLRLAGGEAADLGRAGAGRHRGVDRVDVEGDVGRILPDDLERLGDHRRGAARHEFFHVDDADALRLRPVMLARLIDRTADADLHDALRVEYALLDGAAEGGAVGEAVAAEIGVVGVGMRVEMDHPERLATAPRAARDGAQRGQGGQVIASDGERQRPGGDDRGHAVLDPGDAVHHVDRVDRQIADIGDIGDLERRHARGVMRAAHQARHVAHLARPVAGAGAVRRAAIPRNPDQRDIEPFGRGHGGQAHEGRKPGKARHFGGVDGLVELGHFQRPQLNSRATAAMIPAVQSASSHSPFSAEDPSVSDSTPEGGTSAQGLG